MAGEQWASLISGVNAQRGRDNLVRFVGCVYPGGRFLGRRDVGAAEQVSRWL